MMSTGFILVSYKWFRRTLYIPEFEGFYLEGVSDCEELDFFFPIITMNYGINIIND